MCDVGCEGNMDLSHISYLTSQVLGTLGTLDILTIQCSLCSMLYLDAKEIGNEKSQSFSQYRVGIVSGSHLVIVIYHAVPSLR